MKETNRQLSLLNSMLADWHLLCDQYQLRNKTVFEEDAGLPMDENADQVLDKEQLPEHLVKPIQRYHSLRKLIRWFWRRFLSKQC